MKRMRLKSIFLLKGDYIPVSEFLMIIVENRTEFNKHALI